MPSSKSKQTAKGLQVLKLKSTRLGLSLLCLAVLSPLPALAQNVDLVKQAQQQSKRLSEALNQQQSFQADYLAVSAKGKAKVRLLMNQQKRFALVSVTVDADTQPAYWAVLDYANRPEQPGLIKMFAIVPEEGLQQAELNFRAAFASLDHPLGILRFLKNQTLSLNGKKPIKPDSEDWLPNTPIMELGLTDDHLLINLGVSSMQSERSASWLDLEKLKQALKIDVSPQSVSFTLPDQHLLVIDPRNGMLLKERWDRVAPQEEREISQQAFGALQDQRTYQEMIPNFANLPVHSMPMDQLYQQFAQQLLSELAEEVQAQNLAKSVSFTASQTDALRQAARLSIRAQVRHNLQPEAVAVYQEQVLQPAYQRYKQTHATQAADLSYADYLSRYLAAAEADPEHVQMPGLRQQTAQLADAKNQFLATLKPEQSLGLEHLWQLGWASIEQAWALELLSATIERLQAP